MTLLRGRPSYLKFDKRQQLGTNRRRTGTTTRASAQARGNSTVMAMHLQVERLLTEHGILLHSGATELRSNYLLMASGSLRLLLRSPPGACAIERP